MKRTFTLNEEKNKLNNLRQERKNLLPAWDKLIGNCNFGVKNLTDERKAELIEWHQDLLDLKEEAIHNVPKEVIYYLEEKKQ